VFSFVQSIAFDIFRALSFASEGGIFPLPAIFVLGDSKVYVYTLNGSNIAFYIETPIY